MDPDLVLPSSVKNSKKNIDLYYFVTSLWFFIFEEWCKATELDPDPDVICTDPRIRIRTKMSQIHNTGNKFPNKFSHTVQVEMQHLTPVFTVFRQVVELKPLPRHLEDESSRGPGQFHFTGKKTLVKQLLNTVVNIRKDLHLICEGPASPYCTWSETRNTWPGASLQGILPVKLGLRTD